MPFRFPDRALSNPSNRQSASLRGCGAHRFAGAIHMTETMTAIAIEGGKGPAEALKPEQIPRPEPKAGQILIRVRAAGINRPDIIKRKGFYPPPPRSPETKEQE